MGDVSRKGMVAKYLLSLGFMIVSLVYMIAVFISNYLETGICWSFTSNDWVKNEPRGTRIWFSGFVGMICSALGNFVGTYFVALTFQTAIYAGVNQGVISTLFVLSAIF